MTKEKQLSVQLAIAVILIVFGMILLVLAFFAPPIGEIHSSVLVAYGEVMTFAGALIGIHYRYRYKEYVRDMHNKAQNEIDSASGNHESREIE